VFVRVLSWLLTVVMMAGTVTGARASVDAVPGVAGDVGVALDALDGEDGQDSQDGMMPWGPEPVAVAAPTGQGPVRIEASRSLTRGRMHAVLIFRPPRLAASR
jgi:hypothetical protein